MFFWVVLASLISMLAWGKFGEVAKAPDDYVVPVYEAMVSSLLQQNKMAAEYATKKLNLYEQNAPAGSASVIIGDARPRFPADSGIIFTVGANGKVAGNSELAEGGRFHINAYKYLKMADGFTSAYFCVRGTINEPVLSDASYNGECRLSAHNNDTVVMVVTYGRIPYRYATKSMHYLFQAVDQREPGSKHLGFLRRLTKHEDGTFTAYSGGEDNDNTVYRIYAKGVNDKNAVFIPKGVINFIRTQEGVASLEKYMVAVELIKYKGASCVIRYRSC